MSNEKQNKYNPSENEPSVNDELRKDMEVTRLSNVYPDGSHQLPAGDSVDRPIYVESAGGVAPTGSATAALQTALNALVTASNVLLTAISGKDFATQTTLAAMNAKFVTGTDIGDVTINNAAGAGAYVQPGTATTWTVTNGVIVATAPTLYVITCTVADTEYSQLLPDNTKRISMKFRNYVAGRFAFVTGKVATPTDPYGSLDSGQPFNESDLNLSTKTIYVASSTAGAKVEVWVWV